MLRPGADASRLGYGSAWRKTQAAYLRAHPVCETDGCDEPATDVHHLDGLGPLAPRGFDWENLEGLCSSHLSTARGAQHPWLAQIRHAVDRWLEDH